jgi:hypothetical protein
LEPQEETVSRRRIVEPGWRPGRKNKKGKLKKKLADGKP